MEICAEERSGIPLRTIATVSTQCQHSGGAAWCFRGPEFGVLGAGGHAGSPCSEHSMSILKPVMPSPIAHVYGVENPLWGIVLPKAIVRRLVALPARDSVVVYLCARIRRRHASY